MAEHYGPSVTPTVELIQDLAARGKVLITRHASQRMLQRGISTSDVDLLLRRCEMVNRGIENDPRGQQIRIKGFGAHNEPIGGICKVIEGHSPDDRRVVVITVYWPEQEE